MSISENKEWQAAPLPHLRKVGVVLDFPVGIAYHAGMVVENT